MNAPRKPRWQVGLRWFFIAMLVTASWFGGRYYVLRRAEQDIHRANEATAAAKAEARLYEQQSLAAQDQTAKLRKEAVKMRAQLNDAFDKYNAVLDEFMRLRQQTEAAP